MDKISRMMIRIDIFKAIIDQTFHKLYFNVHFL